ncbi:MAG: hypothetical protein QOK15_3162, partial [Nocardioidaceae bacterium]|nr:hypothetical protein [Nocardioidaceae bacterium]
MRIRAATRDDVPPVVALEQRL